MTCSTVHSPRRTIAVVVASIGLALAAVGCGGTGEAGSAASGDDSPKTLRFAYFSGEKTSFGQLWTFWMDEVEKRSNGSIKFERFWDASLLKAPEMADGLRDGRVDVAQVTPPFYPGKFPVTSVTELPFVSENVPAGAQAISEMAAEGPVAEEWKRNGLKPLAWNIAAPGALGTKEPLPNVAALKGRRLRGNDRSAQVLGMVGANLVNLDLNEIYGAMERDLIDGFFGIPFAFVGPLKFQEVAKNYTNIGMGITTANALSMSEQGWSRLSKEQQDVMIEVSKEIPAKLAETDGAAEDASCEALKAADAKLTSFPESEVEKLRAAGEEKLRSDWAKDVSQAGVDADAVYEDWTQRTADAEAQFSDYTLGLDRCADGGAE
jgi:TRAP-type C4-dicarboxylate transport system substrate-binding protein